MSKITHLGTIASLYEHMGFSMLEKPLFAMERVENVLEKINYIPQQFSYGFYAIGFKKNLQGYMKYGRRQYDFTKGVLSFTAPHQVLSFDNLLAENASGWYLFFHKELFNISNQNMELEKFRFFDYEVNESLHLSEREETEISELLERLNKEYKAPIDKTSSLLLSGILNVLFLYAERYYKRQFITRNDYDSHFVDRFKKVLRGSFKDGDSESTPTVVSLAQMMNISPNYLSDMLRTLTGLSTQGHIHNHIIEEAKQLISEGEYRISEIAYQLGFSYPQHFSTFFKEKTGLSPSEFKKKVL